MASLMSVYFKVETIETILKTLQKKGERGIELTISVNDETNKFEQNVSCYVSQTKDQREAKKDKFFVGNGKVFWTDGKITLATKKADDKAQEAKVITDVNDDVPF